MVFPEPQFGIADGPEDAAFEVIQSADVVDDDIFYRIEEEGIDREIAACHIQRDIVCVKDLFRVSAIAVLPFFPEGGDFVRDGFDQYGNDTERSAEGDRLFEERHDLFRSGVSGDIQIFRRFPEQHIPYTATHQICLISGIAQRVDDLHHALPVGGILQGSGRIIEKFSHFLYFQFVFSDFYAKIPCLQIFSRRKRKNMKIAMFGGTFDPFHTGHAALARYILDRGIVDRVLFVPAPVPPHKTREILPYADRRAMVAAGICGMAKAEISDIECEREGKSYSIDTLRALAERHPGDEICLLIGGDSLATLHLWYKAHEIVQEFAILSYPRPESVVSAESLRENWSAAEMEKLLAGYMTEAPVFPVSSTELRNMLRNGAVPGEALIPASVLNEIQKKNHYRN